MKVYPNKLESELKKTLAPIYIVSGDEALLVQENCDLIRRALRKQGVSEREVFHVEANFDWQQVLFSAGSLSLFAELKLLEIRMSSARPGTAGAAALVSYAEDLPEGTTMLLVLPKLDASSQRSKWFKALDKTAAFIQVWPIDLKDLPNWVDARFRRAGLTASREAVTMLVNRIEGNLLAAVQEIERLKLVAVDGRIDGRQVQAGVADNARYDVFALIDASIGGNAVRTLKIVQALQLEGTELLYIVAMLAKELRGLVEMAREMPGSSLDSVLKKARVWDKRKNLVTKCLREHSLAELQELLAQVGEIDAMVKGMNDGNPWNALSSATLRLAGTTTALR